MCFCSNGKAYPPNSHGTAEEVATSQFQNYCKPTIIKAICFWQKKLENKTNGIELKSVYINQQTFGLFIFNRVPRLFNS